MISASPTHQTLASQLWLGKQPFFRQALLAIGGSMTLWLSAKIQIPFWPVPLTFQTLVVLAIGMAFGWRLGQDSNLLPTD